MKENYIAHEIVRKSSLINTSRLDQIYEGIKIINRKLFLHYGDMTDRVLLSNIKKNIVNFKENLIFRNSVLRGTYKKTPVSRKMFPLSWKLKIKLQEGLHIASKDFAKNFSQIY